MDNWQSGPSADEFIIPDEDIPNPNQTSNVPRGVTNQPQPTNSQSGFSWTPKVDLSTAFTPFITPGLPESNKVSERQYSGGDTLDEPVWHTLKRDLLQISKRLAIVIWPAQLKQLAQKHQAGLIDLASSNGIRLPASIINASRAVPEDDEEENNNLAMVPALDWDLWGPLIFSLAYSVTLGFAAPNSQTNMVFSGTFSFIWVFYLIGGLNIQLLGGTISFLSAISASGYSMFPVVVGAVVNTLAIKWRWLRLLVMSFLTTWSIYAAGMSLRCLGVLPGRVFLAMYPVALMYTVLAYLTVIT